MIKKTCSRHISTNFYVTFVSFLKISFYFYASFVRLSYRKDGDAYKQRRVEDNEEDVRQSLKKNRPEKPVVIIAVYFNVNGLLLDFR